MSESLQSIAKQLVAKKKGILAADESNSTAGKRLSAICMESNEETRRQYRDLFLSADGIEEYLSGVILYDETLRQKANNGMSFVEMLTSKGIIPGIKVDMGAKDFPGFPEEKVTEGLDGLPLRMKEYYSLGARFAKWRAVIRINKDIPTDECIHVNAILLARYARIAQDASLVPIIEPEVLLEGDHDIQTAEEITTKVVSSVFYQCTRLRVDLSAIILKTSMVLAGNACAVQPSAEEVAEATVRMLRKSVPAEVPGVVFLSGGQSAVDATNHLDKIAEKEPLPWEIAFSYARALQGPALDVWQGKEENIASAREVFMKRLSLNQLADEGVYEVDMEECA